VGGGGKETSVAPGLMLLLGEFKEPPLVLKDTVRRGRDGTEGGLMPP